MEDKTHIVYIIDRSGSMSGLESDVIGGFNSFIKEQKEQSGKASFVLIQFDHEYGPVKSWDNIQDVVELNNKSYYTRGCTALLDAVGRTIDNQGKYLSEIPEYARPNKVIVLIMTDGLENASTDYTRERIKEMVVHQQEKYQWKFIFLGANQDSFTEAGNMGIPQNQTSNYNPTKKGVKSTFASTSCLVGTYRSSGDVDFDKTGRPE
jgi:uncharacterized protein YegL